jgi:hypothetical protein
MRKALAMLVLLIVLAGSGFAVLWVLQSSKIEKDFIAQVAQFNGGPMKLTYDALEVSGFPMRMNLNLINPKLVGRMDLLFDPNKQKKLPEWNETALLQGTVQFGIDIFSSHVEFIMSGAWKNTSTIGDQTLSLLGKADTVTQCTFHIKRSSEWMYAMWDFDSLAKRGKELASDFRLFDCFVNNIQLVDAQTNVTLMQSGPQRFYISHEPQDIKREVRVYFKGVDSVVTPDGDRMLAGYYRAFAPHAIPPMASAYGKQNGEIDFTYTGPIDWKGDPKTMPIEAHLGRFNITNDAYIINTTFDLVNGMDNQNQFARVAFKTEAIYNQIYNALVQETIRGAIQQVIDNPTPTNPLSSFLKDNRDPNVVYAIIAPAIPDFYALGKSTAAFDVSFQGNVGFTTGDFTLADLELSVAPYGLTGKGSGKRAAGTLIPAVSVILRCRNCLQMVNDLMLYTNRLHDIAIMLSGTTTLPFFDARSIEGYKEFLRTLAEDDGGGNFTYAIVSDGNGAVTINKKPMDQVLMLYHKLMPQQKN